MDGRLREPATRHQTPFASRSGKYRYHLYHPVRTVLQCTGCRAGVTECTLAAVGGIIALLITHFNFSISAGIGFIALFGICIQNGVIMISDIKHNIQARLPLPEAIKTSMRSRIRPVVMTAAMAAIGLMPAAMSHGIGSESQRPLAIVIIGGLIGATFFALFIFPLIVEMVYKKMLYDKEGNLNQRKL